MLNAADELSNIFNTFSQILAANWLKTIPTINDNPINVDVPFNGNLYNIIFNEKVTGQYVIQTFQTSKPLKYNTAAGLDKITDILLKII